MPVNNSSQEPPSLIQEPEGTKKTGVIEPPKAQTNSSFNTTKVFAAIGLVLVLTILIVAGFWIWLQRLEERIEDLEDERFSVTKVTTSSAKQASLSATPSANEQ